MDFKKIIKPQNYELLILKIYNPNKIGEINGGDDEKLIEFEQVKLTQIH